MEASTNASTKASTGAKTQTYRTWERLSPLPFGARLFSTAAWLRAPYFGTVRPIVVAMRPGYSEVTAKKRWRVHNHIGTFHAIALCNLAEMAMGMLAEATVPTTHRWIPIGMTTAYTRKATTDLRAVAQLPELPAFGDEQYDLPVPVTVTDTAGEVVGQLEISIRIGPR
jgi:acyl-coenzyme A thioesterase PaaI-like protein